jgi:hypothetical protein
MMGIKLNHSQDHENSASDKEPPSLIVGRDSGNHWIVVETHGLCGGIFANETAALRYARDETRARQGSMRSVPYVLALTMPRAAKRRIW